MTNSKNIATFSIVNGVLLALLPIAAELTFQQTGKLENGENWYLYVYYLFFPLFIGFCCYKFRNNQGYLKIENGLVIGLVIGIVSTIIYQVFSFILVEIIDPELYDRMIDKMDFSGLEMTEEQIKEARDMSKGSMKTVGMYMTRVIFFSLSLFLGLLYGVFGGLIFKKDDPKLIV